VLHGNCAVGDRLAAEKSLESGKVALQEEDEPSQSRQSECRTSWRSRKEGLGCTRTRIEEKGERERGAHDAEGKVRVQRRDLEEVRRRRAPHDEVGRLVVVRLLAPSVADLRDGRVVGEEALCESRTKSTDEESVSNGARSGRAEKGGRGRTARVLLAPVEREHDGPRVVAHAQEVELAQLDAVERAHSRAQQAAVRVEKEDAQVLPVVVQGSVDEDRLERRRVDRRRKVGKDRDFGVLRASESRESAALDDLHFLLGH